MCTENSVPADPESVANADECLHGTDCVEILNAQNADPAVPENITDFELIEIDNGELICVSDEEIKGNAFIEMAAEMMRKSLAKQGIIVPAFSAD